MSSSSIVKSISRLWTKAPTRPPVKFNRKYKLKKVWPPDYTKMTLQEQFRFEKRYKRRSALAYLSEGWVKGTKLFQHVVITSFIVYWVVFLEEPEDIYQPFHAIRRRFWTLVGNEEKAKKYTNYMFVMVDREAMTLPQVPAEVPGKTPQTDKTQPQDQA